MDNGRFLFFFFFFLQVMVRGDGMESWRSVPALSLRGLIRKEALLHFRISH